MTWVFDIFGMSFHHVKISISSKYLQNEYHTFQEINDIVISYGCRGCYECCKTWAKNPYCLKFEFIFKLEGYSMDLDDIESYWIERILELIL